jgi:glutathione-regulated potassium-efflux system ancillary protein KefG
MKLSRPRIPPAAGRSLKPVLQQPGSAAVNVLILFAHPVLEKSRVNRRLAAAVRALPGVTFHDLYETYPDFDVDVRREQALLAAHDLIVAQHPFYWYSAPALLKQWQDLVLQHGWAYGRGGEALAGKLWLSTVTTGGRESAYGPDGHNRFTMRQLLAPFEQTARLCGMRFLPPFVVHGTHRLDSDGIEAAASEYHAFIEACLDDRVRLDALDEALRMNAQLDLVITPAARRAEVPNAR